jgi:hypothetical protein
MIGASNENFSEISSTRERSTSTTAHHYNPIVSIGFPCSPGSIIFGRPLAIEKSFYLAEALSALAPNLRSEQLARALEAAQAIGDEFDTRARALSRLAAYLQTSVAHQS